MKPKWLLAQIERPEVSISNIPIYGCSIWLHTVREQGNPKFEFMRHDVTFPLFVEVDQIWNLACTASPIHYQHDPVQTTKTSVHGAINMLGLAKRLGAKILQASTSEVYGDPSVHPQAEDY
jgi:UDP-glucuronate decarboxylase